MIWVLIAITLKFSADGEVMAAQTYSKHESAQSCTRSLEAIGAAVDKKASKTVLLCVPMKHEANA